jgi:hypothetical protein
MFKRPTGGWSNPNPPATKPPRRNPFRNPLPSPPDTPAPCPFCHSTPHTPTCLHRPVPWAELRRLIREPVTSSWPLYPPLVHLRCFTPARHHPTTTHIAGCPRCQFATHAILTHFGPARCTACGCPAHRHKPITHAMGSHECLGCMSIHNLTTHTPLPPLPLKPK